MTHKGKIIHIVQDSIIKIVCRKINNMRKILVMLNETCRYNIV